MKSLIPALFAFAFSVPCFAATYIVCGDEPVQQDATFKKIAVEISSENDDFNGKTGGSWFLSYGGFNWIEKGNITAKQSKKNGVTSVEVKVIDDNAQGGVGTRYVFTDIYADEPQVEKFALGGFAGGTSLGKWSCFSALD
jgi:hypothetical protein